MSLLEDIFLGDEASEAQELERVIEGDDYESRGRSRSRTPDSDSASEKEDEAEEDKRRVDPTKQKAKKVVKNPRQVLNYARLTGPRGISVIPQHFKDFKFKGKGHEKEDLDLVLKKLEHWAYRLYPKFKFEDCLKKIETLGKKQAVSVHLRKIRSDQLITDEPVVQKDSSDDEEQPPQQEDEFDKLLQQQIDLARNTPAPNSVKKGFMTPGSRTFAPPKATSSPSINDDQRERMLRNRRLAEERRLARLKNLNKSLEDNHHTNVVLDTSNTTDSKVPTIQTDLESDKIDLTVEESSRIGDVRGQVDLTEVGYEVTAKKQIKSNVIQSSDEECDGMVVNKNVSVDIHTDISIVNDEMDHIKVKEVIERKRNKSNIIHSSDEECDSITVDHTFGVDVHNDFDTVINKETQPTIIQNDRQLENVMEHEKDVIANEKDSQDNSKDHKNTIDKKDKHEEISMVNTSLETIHDNGIDLNKDEKNDTKIHDHERDKNIVNIRENIPNNDVMDVDFSDDF